MMVVHRPPGSLQIRRYLSLQLIATVLEPDLHLGFGQLQRSGETGPLCAAQIALHVEGGLQLKHLSFGEDGARFLLHRRLRVRAGLLRLRRAVVVGAVCALGPGPTALPAHLQRIGRVAMQSGCPRCEMTHYTFEILKTDLFRAGIVGYTQTESCVAKL